MKIKKGERKKLIEESKKVLKQNHEVYFTKPSPTLYPNQYSWDSGFISIGYSHYDQEKAEQELITLFQGQWKNGMLPHVVYNKTRKTGEFPHRKFWKISLSKNSTSLHTSGITQPPIHATACKTIYQNAKDKERALGFLEYMYPRLLDYHQYLYNYRDPENEGLVYIRHPWESGMDNSPLWDGIINIIHFGKEIKYKRSDTRHKIPLLQRPTKKEYDVYIRLIERFKKSKYDEKMIYKKSPFIVQNVLFNSVLNKSNKDLLWISKKVDGPKSQIKKWITKTTNSINKKLWNRNEKFFNDFNVVSNKKVHGFASSGFMPLYSEDCNKKQAKELVKLLSSKAFKEKRKSFLIPSWDIRRDEFKKYNYWRGPIWININWFISKGLSKYGFKNKSEDIRKNSIELVKKSGFHEYFDPFTGEGYGTKKFSWTASLLIDFLFKKK